MSILDKNTIICYNRRMIRPQYAEAAELSHEFRVYPVGHADSFDHAPLGIVSSVILDTEKKTAQHAIHLGNVGYHNELRGVAYEDFQRTQEEFRVGRLIVRGVRSFKQMAVCYGREAVYGLDSGEEIESLSPDEKLLYDGVLDIGCRAMRLAALMYPTVCAAPRNDRGFVEDFAQICKWPDDIENVKNVSCVDDLPSQQEF